MKGFNELCGAGMGKANEETLSSTLERSLRNFFPKGLLCVIPLRIIVPAFSAPQAVANLTSGYLDTCPGPCLSYSCPSPHSAAALSIAQGNPTCSDYLPQPFLGHSLAALP